MNEVLAKGKERKRLLGTCTKIYTSKNEALAAIANQLISETAYILEENKRILKKVRQKGFLILSLIALC